MFRRRRHVRVHNSSIILPPPSFPVCRYHAFLSGGCINHRFIMSNIKKGSFEYTRAFKAKEHESKQERSHRYRLFSSHGECLNLDERTLKGTLWIEFSNGTKSIVCN